MKKLLIGIGIGIIVSVIGRFIVVKAATLIQSSQVTYSNEATETTNVKESLDELLQKSSECSTGVMCHALMSSASVGASYSASSSVTTYANLYQNVKLAEYTTLELYGTVGGYGTQSSYGRSYIYVYDSQNAVKYTKEIGGRSGDVGNYTFQLGTIITLPTTFVANELYTIKIVSFVSQPIEGYTCYRTTSVSKAILY